MAKVKARVKQWKKDEVNELVSLIKKYDIIGLADLRTMPSRQLQELRHKMREGVLIKVSKKNLIKLAFEKTGHDELINYLEGIMPALIFTNMNPFKLSKIIENSTSPAPIKAGQEAPKDLIVPEGNTPFEAGPIIGDLAKIGVKAKIQKGKIVVIQDSVVAERGEPVGQLAASILLRLGVEPMEVGLNLVCAEEEETIFEKEVLHVSRDELIKKLFKAGSNALNIALETQYFTEQTLEILINKSYNQMRNLVLSTGFFVPELAKDILFKAQNNAVRLKHTVKT